MYLNGHQKRREKTNMHYVHIRPEDALQRLLSIDSLGDAMDELLNMGPMHTADFARLNNALIRKHFPERGGEDVKVYYECVRRDLEHFAGPVETHMIVCSDCLNEVVEDEFPTSEFVPLNDEPLPFDNLECEVCGE
jgi:hypothetical protein